MNSEVKQGEKYQVNLEVEVPAEEMALDIKLAAKRIGAKVDIPGFRKGKVPFSILEAHVGTAALLEEAAETVVNRTYAEALTKHDIHPVAQPEIRLDQIGKDQPLKYTAIITVRPEVKLGDYKGLEVVKKVYEVSEEDVAKELEAARERVAKFLDAEEGAKVENGDQAVIDFTGYVDGEAFEGGAAEDYPLNIGSGSFIPGFEDQVVGMAANEEKDIEVTFPEKYQEESLAGKPATFKVKVKAIKKRILPELDDACAQDISETADTLEQLKKELKDRMQANFDKNADEMCRSEAIAKAVENAEIDIPPVMIENRVEELIGDMARRLEQQGLNMDMYLEYTKSNMEQMREQYKPQAENSVRVDLVMDAIAKAEDVMVEEADIRKQIEEMAAAYWQPAEAIREAIVKTNAMPEMIEGIRLIKAGDLIFEASVVKEEPLEAEPAEESKEA